MKLNSLCNQSSLGWRLFLALDMRASLREELVKHVQLAYKMVVSEISVTLLMKKHSTLVALLQIASLFYSVRSSIHTDH